MNRLLPVSVLAAVLVTGCTDEPPPTEPLVPEEPLLGVTTSPDLDGLFFFGPPVDADEESAADFDPTQLSVLVFEICPEDELDGGDDELLEGFCADPLARWTSDGGPAGVGGEIFLVREENDWYQVDVSLSDFSFDEADLVRTWIGRVVVGDPGGEEGTDFHVYGGFDFELVRTQRQRDPEADPMQVVWDQSLPVKWFLGEDGAEELLCESESCTTTVIRAEEGGELCFPVGDCESGEVTAGTLIDAGALPHDILLRIEDIVVDESDPPLPIPNPQIEEGVDIAAIPDFDELESFDSDGDGTPDIAVQECFFTDDPDAYAIHRGTDAGAERLPFDPRGDVVFDPANCGANRVSASGHGLLDRLHLALRAVTRPLTRALGPRPLRAGDVSFTSDTRAFSPFVPALVLDLLVNEEAAPLVAEGETVTISVCLEGIHPDGPAPTPEPGIDVTFETVDGSLSAGNQSGATVVVATALEEPSGECADPSNPGGDVAVARTSWTLPQSAGEYEARAFLDGDYALSTDGDDDGVYVLEDDIEIAVFFETEVREALAAVDVAAGDRHTCAVDGSGAALCWGQNGFGQLGDGSTTDSDRPVVVSSSLDLGGISAWGDVQDGVNDLAHSCAVTDGDIYCWGYNGSGQLGNGTTTTTATSVPVQVVEPDHNQDDVGDLDFVSVSAGFGFTCARDSGSRVWCWGRNSSGQLGIDDTSVSLSTVPVEVEAPTFFQVAVEAGAGHACALTKAGDVWCWGANGSGQVGDGTTTDRFAPVSVASGIADVSAGERHTCAVTGSGQASCWGENGFDQLGDGSGTDRSSPTLVQSPHGLFFGRIGAGGHHTCATAFTPDDARPVTVCWGANFSGQLGDGSITPSDEPLLVAGGIAFDDVQAGVTHSCGVSLGAGAAYCWGSDDSGQLGVGGTATGGLPTPVLPPSAPVVLE